MAGGSYGRSASLSDSLTNALLIRSFAPREMRPSGSYLGPSNPRSPGMGTMVLIPRRPEICRRATLDPARKPAGMRVGQRPRFDELRQQRRNNRESGQAEDFGGAYGGNDRCRWRSPGGLSQSYGSQ